MKCLPAVLIVVILALISYFHTYMQHIENYVMCKKKKSISSFYEYNFDALWAHKKVCFKIMSVCRKFSPLQSKRVNRL